MHSLPSAIVLDVNLPDFRAWACSTSSAQPATRHIPVHVVSVADYSQRPGPGAPWLRPSSPSSATNWCMPCSGSKPFTQTCGACWWWEDDERQRESVRHLLANDDVEIVGAGHGGRGARAPAQLDV